MAPVAPLLVSLLAVAGLADAAPGPLNPGRHMAPAVYNLGLAGHAKRGLSSLLSRYYGDKYGMSKPPPLEQKRQTSTPAGWTSLGCMNESQGQRLLQGSAFTSGSLTPLLCMTQCQKAGFTYAAMEYSDECYCGNSFVGNGGQKQSDATCSSTCAGDRSQACGAAWFLNVYQYTAGPAVATTCVPVSATPTSAAVTTTAAPTTTSAPTTSKASASATTSAPFPVHTDTDASEWYSLGCAVDSNTRVLSGFKQDQWSGMTIDACLTLCEDKGFNYAGVEYGVECYCGASIPTQITYAPNLCTMPCGGKSSESCGGFWGLDLYELVTAYNECPASSSLGGNAIALPTQNAIAVPSSSTASPSAAAPSASAVAPSNNNVPASSGTNSVWAHHMVGNTYPYGQNDWLVDIRAAAAQGIDGFALNIGVEQWQMARSIDAYAAAQASGLNFKLFLSLDMTSMGCWSGGDAQILVNNVKMFANHPNQAMHNGKVLVSTFAGSDCNFGIGGSWAWQTQFVDALRNQGVNIFFAPSIFSDISTFGGNTWMDGELNWNSAWPMGNYQISTDVDQRYMNALGSKEYMAAVSPFFFTHFGTDSWNKNWLYRSDDWLYCTRWEQIIGMRGQVKQVEILTWNDYGESSYIGPIHGALPSYSDRWVNGMDHQALSVLTQYYATAYKTGSYPAITKDTLVLWTRPHAFNANANDYIGKPNGWDWTTDYVWAVALTSGSATVTLTSGGNTQTFSVSGGLTKLKIPNSPGSVSGSISRNGGQTASLTLPNFSWTTTPNLYNYNYIVGSS